MRWSNSLTLAAQRYTNCWLRTNGLTPPISAESWTEHLQSHLCIHKRALLTCYLDDPTNLHGISYSVTSYDLDKFLLLTLQFHLALVAGIGAWTLPFNAAMSKHLCSTSYPPYILWLPLSRQIFQTWTCSPAQVLIRSLILSSSTQRKQFRMIVVRDTQITFCFPFLLTCSICSCQTVSPHIFGTESKLRLCIKKVQLHPPKIIVCWLSMVVRIYRLFANLVRDLLTDWALAEHQIPDSQFGFCPTRNTPLYSSPHSHDC